jgi:hypothetical protein
MSERVRLARKKETANEVPPIVQDVLSSSGQPLNADTRDFMEPRFGHDFSKVRIHADGEAATAARNINATAYTLGQDIVFDSGEYVPETDTGRYLLAHELAHVVQQSRGGHQTPPPIPAHPLEQAAQQAASIVASGRTAHVEGASSLGIARQPRSLNESLDPTSMSDADLAREIALIRQWLADNPVSSPENDQLTNTVSAMEAEVMQRNGQQNMTLADQGQNQANQAAVTGLPTNITLGPTGAVLASSMAMGNYQIPKSVATFLRALARGGAYEDLVESIESGTYSWNSLYTSGRFTPDQLQDFAERYREIGDDPEAFQELIQEMRAEVSHLEPLAGNPSVAGESELTVVTGRADHFYGQHGGNYSNDPGSSSNPDWESNPAEEEMFGEGSNLTVRSEAEELGMTEGEAALEGGEMVTEGLEGMELLEGAGVAVEAVEGFEAADLLLLLLLL